MARLRDPDSGCPWDLEQNFHTIAPYTLEEAYEVADAIERGDLLALKDELGDLIFQVVYHAQMAAEIGAFDIHQVCERISNKMIRRHPHVFGNENTKDAQSVSRRWDEIKALERKLKDEDDSHLSGVALALPALKRAGKLQKRAAAVGFDWHDIQGVWDKLNEEIAELRTACDQQEHEKIREEVGDLLFTCVNLARHLGVESETALRHSSNKFEQRFRRMEKLAREKGLSIDHMNDAELDELWNQVKNEISE